MHGRSAGVLWILGLRQHPPELNTVPWQLERETSARILRLQQSSSKAERREVLAFFLSLRLIISTFYVLFFFFLMLQHMVPCEGSSQGASFQARAAARHVPNTLT